MFRKGNVFTSTKDIPLQQGAAISAGTVFYCHKGGRSASLCFLAPGSEEIRVITVPSARYTSAFAPAEADRLPAKLATRFGISTAANPVPTFRKGDIVEMTEALALDKQRTLPAGARLRCERGGKTPEFYWNDANGIELSIRPDMEMLTRMKPSQPAEEPAALRGIKCNIKTYPAFSEETVALEGHITADGQQVHVACRGCGDGIAFGGPGKEALQARLEQALTDAGIPLRPGEQLIECLVEHRIGSYGVESFTDYLLRSRQFLDSLKG